MRMALIGLVALALAACDSGTVPSPNERLGTDPSQITAEIDPSLVTVRTDGLTAGAESFYFAAGQNEVEAALARALGKPDASGEMPECGAGPMEYSSFAGGLSVNFQDGNLVGWTLDGDTENIQVIGQVAIGSARDEIVASPGYSAIDGSTLGDEFVIGGALGGFFDADKVVMLYAGTQCFFR